jgi:hypothetical protein
VTAFPVPRPTRVMLLQVPLGVRPSLHPLHRRIVGFIRWLRCYRCEVRLLGFAQYRLRFLVCPMPTTGFPPLAEPEISRCPHNELPHMREAQITPGWADAPDDAPVHAAFRNHDDVGIRVTQAFAALWLARFPTAALRSVPPPWPELTNWSPGTHKGTEPERPGAPPAELRHIDVLAIDRSYGGR